MGDSQGQMKYLLSFLLAMSLCSVALAESIDGRVVAGSPTAIRSPCSIRIAVSSRFAWAASTLRKRSRHSVSDPNRVCRAWSSTRTFGSNGTNDKYGRTIGKVWVAPVSCSECAKTIDANLAQLTTGMAWWYRQYAREQKVEDQGQYSKAEADAQSRRIGLWADPSPMPPWEWRHR